MIAYNNNYFYLETENTSYIMKKLSNGILQHIYYGAKVSQDDFSYYNLFRECAFSPLIRRDGYETSRDTVPQEYPTFGRGDYRQAALLVESAGGRCVNELSYTGYEIFKGKPDMKGLPHLDANTQDIQTLAITMKDVIAGFEVILYYSVFEKEDIISRMVKIINTSEKPIQIRNVASLSIDFETAEFDLISLKGAWARERHVSRRAISQGTTSVESRRGSSSHQLNPFMALAEKNADENKGEVYGFSLIYSADFKALAEVNQLDNTRLQIGINPETFSWKLIPEDSFTSPEALMTYTANGLNAMSQNFHHVCRNHLGKCADKDMIHPIVINSWEAMYFDMSEEKIQQFILNCKGLGIDTFVLDDGWFGHRDDDTTSLGDWSVDKNKFKDGLHSVVDFCHSNGMKFGIWFEPEMISRESLLFKVHPDWCIHCDGAEPVESRQQLVLDMSRSEVVDNIYEQMAKMIKEYDISYIKWDFNRNLTDNGSYTLPEDCQKEHTHRYMLGVYSLMQRLNENFPNVFFEGCSGGGGRFDFGILYYMPQIWTSDDSDAIERLKIQYGTSFVYPPATMVAHVSACPNHQTGRTTPFETRGEVAQMCNYGYELDVGMLSEEEKEQIKAQVAKHRELEPLILRGDYYRLKSPFESNLCVWQLVSEDKSRAYVCAAFQTTVPNPKGEYVRLMGLNENKQYRIMPWNVIVGGDSLMHAGLPLIQPAGWDYKVLAFDLQEVEVYEEYNTETKEKITVTEGEK